MSPGRQGPGLLLAIISCAARSPAQAGRQVRHPSLQNEWGLKERANKELRVLRRFPGNRGPNTFLVKEQVPQPIPKGSRLPECQASGAARGAVQERASLGCCCAPKWERLVYLCQLDDERDGGSAGATERGQEEEKAGGAETTLASRGDTL